MSVLNEFPPKTQLVEMFKIKVAFDTAVTAASSSQDNFDGLKLSSEGLQKMSYLYLPIKKKQS